MNEAGGAILPTSGPSNPVGPPPGLIPVVNQVVDTMNEAGGAILPAAGPTDPLVAPRPGAVPVESAPLKAAAELPAAAFSSLAAAIADLLAQSAPGQPAARESVAPAGPTPRAPWTPNSPVASAAPALTLFVTSFAALLLLARWAVPRLSRRFDAFSAAWRPLPALALLERPG
jgi:hypothetical protein